MNISITPEAQKAQWQASLAILSDAALIEQVNREVGNLGWTSSRGVYLQYLSNEIRTRTFNSDVLFDYDSSRTVASLKLQNKVLLVKNTLEFKNSSSNSVITTKSCKTFTAQVTIGLQKQYSTEIIPLNVFKEKLLKTQQTILEKYNVELSTKIRQCEIIFLGQDEPSVELEFIQYPIFLQEESVLKNAIVELTKLMMFELDQNRVVIVFSDETIMLEQSDAIDPNIQL
jgi:hypothetical protein